MRLEQLTFTRFLAAIAIVIFHFGGAVDVFDDQPLSFLFWQANVGVSYFFILSGFVMMIAYANRQKVDFTDYLKRRFARIYPVYVLAIFLLGLYFIKTREPIDYTGLLLNLTLLQSWVPGKALSFNSAGWSLSVEIFFYLLFPFLFNQVYQKYPFRKIALLILLFFVVSQALFHFLRFSPYYKGPTSAAHDIIHYLPLMHLNEFLVGNLAGLFFLNSNLKERNYDFLIIGLTVLAALSLKLRIGILYHNGMLAFLFVPIIVLMSANKGVLTKMAKARAFVFLGEISYGIYILQFPVFLWAAAILKHFNFITSPGLLFLLKLMVLVLLSALSYTYMEVPLRKRINHLRFKGLGKV